MVSNILIIGSGGREHALGWKLSKSKHVNDVFYCPGNGGTSKNIAILATDFDKIKTFAIDNNCLIVVGPEEPLTRGIVNILSKDIKIFGPTKEAAQLESSKSFAKKFLRKNNIQTPAFSIFTDPEKAKDYVYSNDEQLVIKADGLAAGKGVIVCENREESIEAIDRIMVKKEFGDSGRTIVIEERIFGEEVTFIGISDGNTIFPVATSQDHKRIYDDDKGPNTGGMGSLSPSPIVSKDLFEEIMENIMKKTIYSMKNDNRPFKGFLYAGLMIEKQTKEPFVLEFNVRMGDPECQPIMMRMKSDLYEYVNASICENLNSLPYLEWFDNVAVCIVMAEKGYPLRYKTGHVIRGLNYDFGSNVMIFHAGTAVDENKRVVTNGGRVLGVTATGDTFTDARTNVYSAVKKIDWGTNDKYYRTDIALKAKMLI